MRLEAAFTRARCAGRGVFVAYVVAGDPDVAASKDYIRALVRAGVDIIELGVPHSDPVADGPVNMRGAERALMAGASLKVILAMVAELRAEGLTTPIILFSYCNPLMQFGLERLARRANEVGIDAVLVVDMPPEEAEDHCRLLHALGIGTIFLATPNTSTERLAVIARLSSHFVYYVSRFGVTGPGAFDLTTLAREAHIVRAATCKPICIGFGIATPELALKVVPFADGIIVGSALVEKIAAGTPVGAFQNFVTQFVNTTRSGGTLCLS